MVNPEKYVVLDVETNGISCVRYDLLSISLYLPDKEKKYTRFLPLELNDEVFTTSINGITKSKLKKLKSLSQEEVDSLEKEFELDRRTILTFSNLDEKFIMKYFVRHGLQGAEKWNFYDIKHDIISSRFSHGQVTKDNLCMFFGIPGVKKVHSGINDCVLEWRLFEKLDNKPIFIIDGSVFRIPKNYIIPVSYLVGYRNFRYHVNIPELTIKKERIKSFRISNIEKFQTNLNGFIIEDVIDVLVKADEQNNRDFLIENKNKLEFIGNMLWETNTIHVYVNSDGTIRFFDPQYREEEKKVNSQIKILKRELSDVAEYIKEDIFKSKKVMAQEMSVNEGVLALCDLSTEDAVLEMKTYEIDNWDDYKLQLYYEAKGRDTYCMTIDWHKTNKSIQINFYRIDLTLNGFSIEKNARADRIKRQTEMLNRAMNNENLEVIKYLENTLPVTIRCNKCNNTFEKKVRSITESSGVKCPYCELPVRKRKAMVKNVHRSVKVDLSVKKKEYPYKKNDIEKLSVLNLHALSPKYRLLTEYLRINGEPIIELSISDIENLIRRELPESARSNKYFWGNYSYSEIGRCWLAAGYIVKTANLEDETVVFEKEG